MSRADRVRSRAKRWLDLAGFSMLFWTYAAVLWGLLAKTDVGSNVPVWVGLVLWFGAWAIAYPLAVQTLAWWRRRQARQDTYDLAGG